MDGLKERGISYISNRTVINNDAVMFDIDDTLIFTSGRLNVPIYELLIIAKRMGYKIIIITARPSFEAIAFASGRRCNSSRVVACGVFFQT
mgnify:CR=1 FL=1